MKKTSNTSRWLLIIISFSFIFINCSKEEGHSTNKEKENAGTVVFREDFNSSNIDENVWQIGTWSEHGGQLSKDRCFVKDGYLHLLFMNDNGNFKSSAIQSKDEFLYGKWEVRLKPTSVAGMLNSFYTIDWDDRQVNGDGDGTKQEIDIEFLTHTFTPDNGKVHFAVHASNLTSFETKPDIELGFNPSDDFHVWAINITSEFIEWSVDGKVLHIYQYDKQDIKINQPYMLKLNHWSAVDWIQGPPESGVTCEYLIDWIQFTTYDKYTNTNTTTH